MSGPFRGSASSAQSRRTLSERLNARSALVGLGFGASSRSSSRDAKHLLLGRPALVARPLDGVPFRRSGRVVHGHVHVCAKRCRRGRR